MTVITPQKSVSQQPKEQRGEYIHLPNTEKLASSHTKGNIRAIKVMYRSLGQHEIVFELGFAQEGQLPAIKTSLAIYC